MTKGIAISQQGIPVSDAQDAQKVLDSRTHYLEILDQRKFTFPHVSDFADKADFTLCEHNLGFVPVFDIYNVTYDIYWPATNNTFSTDIWADDKKIKSYDPFGGGQFSQTNWDMADCIITIYNIEAGAEYQAPVVVTAPKFISKPNRYGARAISGQSKKDITDDELSSFSLNTTGKAFAIHQTGTIQVDETANGIGSGKINHQLGGPPSFLSYYMSTDKSKAKVVSFDYNGIVATAANDVISFRGAQAALVATIGYVLFKEFADLAV